MAIDTPQKFQPHPPELVILYDGSQYIEEYISPSFRQHGIDLLNRDSKISAWRLESKYPALMSRYFYELVLQDTRDQGFLYAFTHTPSPRRTYTAFEVGERAKSYQTMKGVNYDVAYREIINRIRGENAPRSEEEQHVFFKELHCSWVAFNPHHPGLRLCF